MNDVIKENALDIFEAFENSSLSFAELNMAIKKIDFLTGYEYSIIVDDDGIHWEEEHNVVLREDLTIITSWSLWSDGIVSYYSAYFNDSGQEVKVIEEKEWKTVIEFLQAITE